MKKSRKNRFLGILLSLALVLGLMPGVSLTAYADADTITWNSSNVFNEENENIRVGVPNFGFEASYTFEGITISCSGSEPSFFLPYDPSSVFQLQCHGDVGDSFAFTAPTGKQFYRIEINGYILNFEDYGSWKESENDDAIVWNGTPSDTVTLGTVYTSVLNIDSIVFYFGNPTVDVTGVTLNKESTTLTVGAEETLTATVAPEGATDKNVTWSSSNTDVATVDANGKVTAVGAGKANITATATNGTANVTSDDKAATCEVTVIDPKLPDGKYAQGAVVDNVNYTRFVYVLPLSELDGKNKATFTVTKGNASATFDTSYYYTGMVSSGVTYKPANDGSVMLICNVKGAAPDELTCTLSIDGEVYEPNN